MYKLYFFNIYYFSTNCVCSNSLTNSNKLDIFECNGKCVGDSTETCGGYGRIKMYDLKSK